MKINFILTQVLLLVLSFLLGGCLGIEHASSHELEIAKWHFDREQYAAVKKTVIRFANKDYPDAQYMLGYMYFYGKAVPVNRKLAGEYLKKSAAQKYPPAVMAMHIVQEAQRNESISIVTPAKIKIAKDSKKNIEKKKAIHKPAVSRKIIKGGPRQERLDDNKILSIDGELYTIKMLELSDVESLIKLVDYYKLYDGYYIYRHVTSGVEYFTLINGRYSKRNDAKWAVGLLPKNMREWNPSIVQYKEIHRQIQSIDKS